MHKEENVEIGKTFDNRFLMDLLILGALEFEYDFIVSGKCLSVWLEHCFTQLKNYNLYDLFATLE